MPPTYVLDYGPTASGLPVFTVFQDINIPMNLLVDAPTLSPLTSGWTIFTWNSGIVVHFRAELGLNFIAGVLDQTDGVPVPGEGSRRVDHNYGGIDTFRILETGTNSPLDNAALFCYLLEDFIALRTDQPDYIKGQSITDANGRWVLPMWLDPGEYIILVIAPLHQAKSVSLTVV